MVSSRLSCSIFLAAIVLTMIYVFWNDFAASVLTIRYTSGAVAISAAFGAAWLTVLKEYPRICLTRFR